MKNPTNKSWNLINTVNEISTTARNRKIAHLIIEDDYLDGRTITVNSKKLINFGSCSYLGLETDQRLKDAACDAVQRYGSQFSASRTYISVTLYQELERHLEKIFDVPVLLAPSTTLGHQAVMPIIMGGNDAVILDQQAHYSMQDVANHMQLNGTYVTKVRHNRLDELKDKICQLVKKYEKVWYVIDGVYSMYGDIAPIADILLLLEEFKQFHLYVDDAHGMSWAGKNGRGSFLSHTTLHPKMVLATSLAKGFGSAGGCFIFPDEENYWKVKNWGGVLTHSGPQQPAVLGASIASAKIHLSNEIYLKHEQLKAKINYCNQALNKFNLPVVAQSNSPIFFIGLGTNKVGYNLVQKIINDGFYVNLGIFPCVPENCTGIRFTINLNHTVEDIDSLAESLCENIPQAFIEEERTMVDIRRGFKALCDFSFFQNESNLNTSDLKVQYEKTIERIPKSIWDDILGSNGIFDWNGLKLLEEVFSNNEHDHDNWDFHYLIIRDSFNKIVAATFFTSAFIKDDLLSPSETSRKLEEVRLKNPNYLISKALLMGSLITSGNHLYLNKQNPFWKKALSEIMERALAIQEEEGLSYIYLRDFEQGDETLSEVMTGNGFIKLNIPSQHVLINTTCKNREDYINQLSSKKRNLLKSNVLRLEAEFIINKVENANSSDVKKWYRLYNNVREQKFEINSFPLPEKFFHYMAVSSNFDCIELRLKANPQEPVAVMFNYKNKNYTSLLVGLDYNYLESYRIYKQILFQTIVQGIENNYEKTFLGFTASLEKRKLNASAVQQVGYIQMKDNFNFDLLTLIPQINEFAIKD